MILWHTKRGYRCETCLARFTVPLQHPTLGVVCPMCHGQLKRGKVRRPKISSALRQKVAERDGWICQICGSPVDPNDSGRSRPSMDHIIPLGNGGATSFANLQLAHQICNERRHSRPRAFGHRTI